jgi:hypothetical protein
MARPTKQRPPVNQEVEESKAHEMGETPEEETREGTEDGPSGKTNRKRSPKGAKNTKAPMDGECGCGGKKGASCDGGCGSGYAKKMDALSPQEYLAACDLGIQDRSRPYIRARLDATERLDLKCGNGSISEGEKCSKGSAQKVDPKAQGKGKGVSTALKVAAGVALVGAAALGAKKYGPKAIRNAKASMLKTKRSLQQTTRETIRNQMKKEGATPAQWAEWRKSVPKSGSSAAEREAFKDFFYKNTPGVRRPKADSVWAQGFAP